MPWILTARVVALRRSRDKKEPEPGKGFQNPGTSSLLWMDRGGGPSHPEQAHESHNSLGGLAA